MYVVHVPWSVIVQEKIFSLVPRLLCHKPKTNPVVGDPVNCTNTCIVGNLRWREEGTQL